MLARRKHTYANEGAEAVPLAENGQENMYIVLYDIFFN